MASLFNPNPPLVSFSSIRPSSFNPSKVVSNFNQTSIITNNTDVIAYTKLFSSSLSMATGRSSAGVDNTSRKLPVLLFDIMDTLVRDPFYDDVPAFFRMPMEELLELKDPTVWIEFEKGLIDEAELEKRFFKDERPIDFEVLHFSRCC
ncbi:hypothetical protein IC582_011119 [Cucumis melo]